MSVTIDTVTIGGIEDRRMVLNNASAARVLSIGTGWNSIRIGIRISCTDTGADLSGATFYLGLLSNPASGMTNGPLTSSCSHFVGAYRTGAFTRTTLGGVPLYSGLLNANHFAKKVGSTITQATTANNGGYIIASPSSVRDTVFCDIEKGSPNFSMIANYTTNATGVTADVSKSIFDGAFEVGFGLVSSYMTNLIPATNHGNTSTNTLAVSEASDGYLNAICLAWNQTVAVMHVSDFSFSILS